MNEHYGFLRVRVYTSKKMLPIKNARVEVSRMENGEKKIYANVLTDENGNTGDIQLPALPKEYSMSRMFDSSGEKPYLVYDVMTEADNYKIDKKKKVSIFEGVVSIQSVELILLDI